MFAQFLHKVLAKIGKKHIDEIENPELGIDRVKSLINKFYLGFM